MGINAAGEDLNEEMKVAERGKKDELKQKREAAAQEQTQSSWKCSEQGCHFAGWSKAGLVNCQAKAQLSGTASAMLLSL